MAETAPHHMALADRLAQLIGADYVARDEDTRRAMSEDVFSQGGVAGLVVAPANLDELSQVLEAAHQAGAIIVPRGGGMSYTSGFVTEQAGAVVIDMRRMDQILSVSAEDMLVTVQAGATWASLQAALTPLGLRTPFWGPLSGLSSTIGGGLSQLNAFFGAGIWGTTSESVTCLTVVLADGSILRTGSAGTKGGSPFFKHYGPDLAGLFCGDCGALGIKAEITLRLIPAPAHEAHLSFAMPDLASTARATAAVARTNLASEVCAFDPNLAKIRMRRASLLQDVKTLAAVIGAQKNVFESVKQGAKMALAGRGFMDDAGYTLHLITEGASAAQVEEAARTLRDLMKGHGGREIENTIPKAMRAAPFTPLNNILGPDGERWVPIHGIVPLSHGEACWLELDDLFASYSQAFEARGMTSGYLVTTLSTNGFLIEPVFFWPDARYGIHETTLEPSYLAKVPKLPANADNAALVDEVRGKILDIFERFGATHFQIGRTYRYAQTREPVTLALLKAIKAHLDPDNRMNPGVLGL
jgi:D-lactate dehydrogenase (cytochrome)